MGSITHAKVIDTALNADWTQTEIDAQIAAGNLAPGTTPADIALNSDYNDPHNFSLDKSDVGLSNVDNTSDADKPVSTATQTALNLKQDVSTLQETVEDIIGTKVVAGSNVTVSYNDTTGETTIAASGGGGGAISWSGKTGNYTASAGDYIYADTSGGVFTITLPATPATGAAVTVKAGSSVSTNNLTIARNGSTIMSLAENMTVAENNIEFTLVYSGSTWRL